MPSHEAVDRMVALLLLLSMAGPVPCTATLRQVEML
jgi:hypothetical protein